MTIKSVAIWVAVFCFLVPDFSATMRIFASEKILLPFKFTSVWIDSDISLGIKNRDVDDGLALIQAFHSPEIILRGISTVFGNTGVSNSYNIASTLNQKFGPPGLAVYLGADGPRLDDTPASRAMANLLARIPFTIVALGPLTNIATLIKNHPNEIKNIERIIIVAGRKPGDVFRTGNENPEPHRDFNFEMDTAALQWILDSNLDVVLIPFELSSKIWIYETDLEKFSLGGDAARFVLPASMEWLHFWKSKYQVDGFNPFDTLAMGFILKPGLFDCEPRKAQIEFLPDDTVIHSRPGNETAAKSYLTARRFTSKGGRRVIFCSAAAEEFKVDLLRRLLDKNAHSALPPGP
jgi:inosine-uridine nucleoside N-ribohydrolase